MKENSEQAIVLIQESEDGPTEHEIAEIERKVQDTFDSEITVNSAGDGLIAVNTDDLLVTARELNVTVDVSMAYGVTDFVITSVENADNVQEMLNG